MDALEELCDSFMYLIKYRLLVHGVECLRNFKTLIHLLDSSQLEHLFMHSGQQYKRLSHEEQTQNVVRSKCDHVRLESDAYTRTKNIRGRSRKKMENRQVLKTKLPHTLEGIITVMDEIYELLMSISSVYIHCALNSIRKDIRNVHYSDDEYTSVCDSYEEAVRK